MSTDGRRIYKNALNVYRNTKLVLFILGSVGTILISLVDIQKYINYFVITMLVLLIGVGMHYFTNNYKLGLLDRLKSKKLIDENSYQREKNAILYPDLPHSME